MKNIILAFVFVTGLVVNAAETTTIKVDGSSTVYPIMEAFAEEFQISTKGKTKVTAGISGTGGGFKKFCRGEIDIADASRPISTSEIKNCKDAKINFYELPVAFDAIVIAVHPSNPMNEIKLEDLKKIWSPDAQGKILMWNQVNQAWPATKLKLYGAGADSGTFDYFTEVIVGKAKSSRGDYTASEDDNTLVNGISGDKNALGFIPMSYYNENKKKLKALAVQNSKGQFVLPSEKAVVDGSYAPLSRPLFIYISSVSSEKPEVKSFVEYSFANASKLVAQAMFVALPEKAYVLAADKFKNKKMGTVFTGHSEANLTIEQLLKKESK